MNKRQSGGRRHQSLAGAAAAYQASDVIPHCAVCTRPCCRLDKLVLELEWKQVKWLWQLKESRSAFDNLLASGQGPMEIREGGGLYYAHQKACPAYDEAGHNCRIYDSELKPVGCSDFPVYQDHDTLIADLRCEAVDLDVLAERIARRAGPEFRVLRRADPQFPFLVTLSLKSVAAAAGPGRRPRAGK